MEQFLSEVGNIVLPAVAASVTTNTTSTYVLASRASGIECGILIQAGAGVTAAERFTLEILAASDKNGTGAEVVKFEQVFSTLGAPGMAAGTGLQTRLEQEVSPGVKGKVASYVTLAANGNKQELVMIPIRTRQLPKGKPWVAMKATTAGNARTAQFFFIRINNQYAQDSGLTSILV